MSVVALAWAWKQPVKLPVDRLVLLAIADHAGDDHVAFPSQTTIAVKAMCSVDTVQRAIKRLENAGMLSRQRRGSHDGGRSSDLFRLNVDVAIAVSSAAAPTSSRKHRKLRSNSKPQIAVGGNAASDGGVTPHSCAEVKPHNSAVGTITEPPLEPSVCARDGSGEFVEVKSAFNGSTEAMLAEVQRAMGPMGDRRGAEQWLATTLRTYGREAVSEAFQRLATARAEGQVIARVLPYWSRTAETIKARAPKTPNPARDDALRQIAAITGKPLEVHA